METRSRKRAEATSTAHPSSSPSPTTRSGKRFRKTQSSSTSASIPTRTRVTRAHPSLMDPFTPVESTSSSSRSRRNRNNNNESSSSDKGKAKEHEVRARDRDNQTLKLDIENYDNNPNEDDDDDSEGGIGAFHPNLTSASSALQGLLRKLGAGFDDLLPGSGIPSSSSSLQHLSGRMKKILSGLQADGEEGKQVEALTQLCDILSIGTEESLSSFSVDVFVPVLVGLLSYERNADIMLLAARAITHLCEVLPSSCGVVVHYGAIPCLVSRLVNIEYMDVFEQSLQALTKISLEHPTACLRAGALTAVLSYLDFFSIEVQRVALSTAANMCKKIPSDAAHFAMDAVPSLTSRLQYHDTRVLEHASVCLTRIAEAFASCPDQLDALCNHGVVTEAASLISSSNSGGGQTSLSPPIYTGLIRLLSTCASGSPLGTKTLLHLGISGILKDILSGSSVSANITVSPALSRPAEQMFEIVNLANELLPPLPPETISIPAGSNNLVKGPIVKKPSSANSGKQFADGNDLEVSAREKLLKDHPELLEQFGIDLLPVMIQMYGSSVNSSVRHKCLSVIGKLMYFSSAEMIQSLINVTNISSFLAGVLAWKDPQVLVPTLQIAEILMEKLPTTFSKIFVREGVLHAIDQLAMSGNSNTKSIQPSHSEKDNDSSSVSSRSRRYKRRGDSTNKEGSSFEESKNPILGNIGSPPSSIEIPMLHSNLRMHVSACAKAFKDKYFPSAAEVGVTEDLLHLKNLCAKLNAGVNDQKTIAKGKSKASGSRILDCSAVSEECLIGIISEILTELGKGDGVSTFEFVGSGVVSALLNYLSCGFFSREKILEANLPKLREQALKRYKMFVSLALPSIDEKSATPMTILVQKLQNALTSLERFPVVLSQSSRSSSGIARLSSGLGALAQTCKLRLCRAQGEKSLRDYSSNVVLIDPLASLAAVEQFLWPRIQRGDSGKKSAVPAGNSETPAVAGGSASSTSIPSSNTRRHSSRSRSSLDVGDASRKEPLLEKNASLSKGKGKAVLKAALEEAKGPQTRNATRRRAALDKDEQVKPENGDSSSEDDELDVSHVELDDAMVIEDDDISEDDNDDNDDDDDDHEDVLRDDSLPVCMPDKVHDVKLGNTSEDNSDAPATDDNQTNLASGSSSRAAAVRGSDSSEFRFGSSYGSRGALSFAAAAMAGLGSANGRGIRGHRDRQGRSPFGSSNDPPKLIFSVGGKPLYRNLTIYQAVQKQLMEEEDDDQFTGDFVSSDGSRLWNDICTITYRRADTQSDGATAGATSSTTSKSKKSSSSSNSDSQPHQLSLLDSILQGELPCELEKSNPTYNILALLRVLEGLNQLAPRLREQVAFDNFVEGNTSYLDDLNSFRVKVSSEDFINNKLTPKLARQVQDALALCSGSVPSWCFQLTKACPFLFPFETRRQYFYSTAFGLSRALYRLQQQQGAEGHASNNERELRVGRLQRQKVRVSRNRILDSALKVMEMYSSQKAVLEVEYFGEVGTGLGPTLEFYTLLSRDLQKLSLGLWRSNASFERASMDIDDEGKDGVSIDADLVQAPLGLFPRPWHPNADASGGSQYFKVIEYFRLLGRVMAKALQDGRLLDLPLSMAFYKLVLGQELDLFDILSFDMELGKVLQELHAIVLRKHYLESRGNDKNDAIADLRFRGASIEDLCFDFSLPGYPEYILKPGNETVDINNLEEYISLVVDATVKSGFVRQMEAFRAGFNQVFDISSLQIFSPQELDYLLCGRRELWEPQTLVDYIKFDHGYTAKSPAIVNLLEIMGEFTPEQQQAFCQFVTGAPRLPPGGLAVLNPRLTIVRKHSAAGNASLNGSGGVSECADEDLPSVMTCANYLKLPPYSTKEIMYKKLLFAINEGQGSFDLS